jgi:hypothetical protein
VAHVERVRQNTAGYGGRARSGVVVNGRGGESGRRGRTSRRELLGVERRLLDDGLDDDAAAAGGRDAAWCFGDAIGGAVTAGPVSGRNINR